MAEQQGVSGKTVTHCIILKAIVNGLWVLYRDWRQAADYIFSYHCFIHEDVNADLLFTLD